MSKYDELTNRLGNYFLGSKRIGRSALIEPFEHGFKTRNGPRPVNLKAKLIDKRIGRPERCSRTHLREHLGFHQTYYYRSNRRSGFALVNLDIDAHNGEPDALAVAETIEQFYFPNSYHEPSTHGEGRHHFLLIWLPRFQSNRESNAMLKSFGIALREIMIMAGFQATIDVKPCRTFSIFKKQDDGKYVPETMGQLAKMPRPRNLDDMRRLEAAPIYHYSQIESVIAEYKRLRGRRQDQVQQALIHRHIGHDTPVCVEGAVKAVKNDSGAFVGMDVACPLSRATHAVAALARQLRRLPIVAEAREFYEQSGLASGMSSADIRRRERRIAAAIEHVAKTFDVGRAGNGVAFSTLLPVIAQHVLPEHRAGTKYEYGITDEDLAIALHVIETASFERKTDRNHQWTVGNNRIMAMFRAVKRQQAATVGAAGGRAEGRSNNTCVSTQHRRSPPSNTKKSGISRRKNDSGIPACLFRMVSRDHVGYVISQPVRSTVLNRPFR